MRTKKKIVSSGTAIALFLMLLLLNGCSNNSIVNPSTSTNNNAAISFKAPTANNNTIVLTSVKVLLKEIEFENEGGNGHSEVEFGPIVLNLNLNSTVSRGAVGTVNEGTYNKVSIKIHKADENETLTDPEFREGTDGEHRYSVIVKGLYNGVNFVYKSKTDMSLEIEFEHGITFTTISKFNLTSLVNPYSWFMFNGTVLDPTIPNNASIIDNNIRSSFNIAYEDDDNFPEH